VAAEKLRHLIAASAFEFDGVKLSVTASFGVSGWRGAAIKTDIVDALIGKCDAAVYASKAAGRNHVTVAPMD
jgi:GGDEF domain-containing protein